MTLSNMLDNLDNNEVTLKYLYNLEQDMGLLLDNNSTLKYYNCENINLTIGSEINKIIFVKCSNINVVLNGLVSGLEIKNSSDININNGMKKNVSTIKVENSLNVNIIISKQVHKETVYEVYKCHNISVIDHSSKKLLL
jgi:hypothetical protein